MIDIRQDKITLFVKPNNRNIRDYIKTEQKVQGQWSQGDEIILSVNKGIIGTSEDPPILSTKGLRTVWTGVATNRVVFTIINVPRRIAGAIIISYTNYYKVDNVDKEVSHI